MRSFLAHLTMAITDTEIMSEIASIEIRTENKAILIDFVRVVRNEADPSSKGILSNYVPFNQLRLHLLQLTLYALHHLHYFSSVELCWGRRG